MSHTKNVEALDKVLGICTGYGVRYNPVQNKLQLSTMSTLLANANKALREEKLAKTNYNNVANTREIMFKEIPKLASSMVFTLAASNASEQAMIDARYYFRQVNGRGKSREPVPEGEVAGDTRKRRSGRLSYTSIADNFERLVHTVSTDPNYQPNEIPLQAGELQNKVVQLKDLNSKALVARTTWSYGLIARNQFLYTNNTAIFSTINSVKKYVRAVFGLGSAEYALLKGITVTKLSS